MMSAYDWKADFLSELQSYTGQRLSTDPSSLIGTIAGKIDRLEFRIMELERQLASQQIKVTKTEDLHPGYNSSYVLKV